MTIICSGKAHNNTRMDNMWALRQALVSPCKDKLFLLKSCSSSYAQAKMKVQREHGCCSGQCCSDNLSPEDYGWELLAEVLRGNAKVSLASLSQCVLFMTVHRSMSIATRPRTSTVSYELVTGLLCLTIWPTCLHSSAENFNSLSQLFILPVMPT